LKNNLYFDCLNVKHGTLKTGNAIAKGKKE